jgi:hypothetical protein
MPNPSSNKEADIPQIPFAPKPREEVPTIPLSRDGQMHREEVAMRNLFLATALMVIGSSLAGAGISEFNQTAGTIVEFGGYGLSVAGLFIGAGLWIARDNGDLDFSEKPYFPTQEEKWSAETQLRANEIGENIVASTISNIRQVLKNSA